MSFYNRNAARCARCHRLLGPDDSPLGCSVCKREDEMTDLLARSSLGTPEALAIRARAPKHIVDAILKKTK